ncbi:MAG: hypothetical protein ABGX05_04495 [Pirellulaceae bacterium]
MRIRPVGFTAPLLMALLLVASLASSSRMLAAEKSAAQLLPKSTLLYVSIPQPAELLDTIWNHPLRSQIEALDVYQQAFDTAGYRQYRIGLALVETTLGMNWRTAWKKLTGGGIHLAFDPQTKGVLLLIKAEDAESQRRTVSLVIENFKRAAKKSDQPSQYKEHQYRGITSYQTKDFVVGVAKPWLILSNKGDLAKKVVDLYLDGGNETLAASREFQQVQAGQDKSAIAWAYVGIQGLRDMGVKSPLLLGQSGNPLNEVLFGGLLSNLQKTPYIAAELKLDNNQLQWSLQVPHKQQWISESRQYYFGPAASGSAPVSRETKETVFSLATHRDVSQMWLYSPDLYDDKMNESIAQAEGNLVMFFGGRDLAEDILGAFGPQWQLIVTRQAFAKDQPLPAIQLPAFALDLRMKKPEVTTAEMRRTFLSLVGFVNVIGAMNGQPQLDFDILKETGKTIITSNYLPGEQTKKRGKAPINYNFSPTVTFQGERFILASTLGLARELLTARELPRAEAPGGGKINTTMQFHAAALKQILADNQQQLVAQNMLSEGHSKEEAEKEIANILELIELVRGMTVELIHRSEQLELKGAVLLKSSE